MSTGPLTQEQVADFERDGYLMLPGLFETAEIETLRDYARGDEELAATTYGRRDATGIPVKLRLWNHPSDDLYGLFSRSPRLVDRAEQLLGGEVYHYHTKMILKEAQTGGAWEWHQDYGYWYHNGCLFPDLVSCLIAVDPATRENGCLQVIRGSHRMGRIEHATTGDQTGADMERVEAALERLEHVYIEADPGDVFMFHSNLLHRSDANRSEHPRWALICCYNAKANDPYKESRHPRYEPLDKADDTAILQWRDGRGQAAV